MWEWFINGLVWVLETFAGWFGDYGLAIIAMTIIFRLLLMPLTMRQLKSSARMQVLQPKLQEIQDRYADDPDRMQEEMRRFQAENNFNPLGGCLPVLLQWPIFFALFGALRTISEAHPDASFLGIMPSISMSAAGAWAEWGFVPAFVVYALMDVFFGLLTFIPMLLTTRTQADEQRKQSMIMGGVMGVMMIWMGWNVAGGVLLYYDTSAVWGVVQQLLVTRRVIDKAKAEEEERLKNQPVKVDVVRKERKPRPKKKS